MDAVGERFGSDVEVESIAISMLPRPRVRGRGLVLRPKHRTDVPPLIIISSFSAEASLLGLFRHPLRLSRVDLEGLEVNVPPGGMHVGKGADNDGSATDTPDASPIVIATVVSEHAVLRILRRESGKPPRLFQIFRLDMKNVGADDPWPFRASLTNPTPPGDIETVGTFGPWNTETPSQTPLAANYTFAHADLGVFDGIRGTLSSTGKFSGVLERIDADGDATVPAFALSDVGNPVPLQTHYHSIIDGTNGNTLLQPVDAQFLHTKIHASGGVVERKGQDGRTTTLDIVMDEARLEDVLRLAVKGSRPPMSGALKLKATLVLPPGRQDNILKLHLDGTFDVATARFLQSEVQAKMNEYSTKARGVSDDTPDPVVSDFTGRFHMRDGVLQFDDVTFSMPGARVNVAGRYAMKTEAIDFRGTIRLDAKLSSLTTGVKATVLKLFDGLFRHQDVTVIPITIGGTAKAPKVSLDVGRVFKKGD
jgi:hypothetical protein